MEENSVWQQDKLAYYLSVYYSDQTDWMRQLDKLWSRNSSRENKRRQIAYTILSPYFVKTRPTDPVEALLFVCFKFDNFNEINWEEKLEEIFKQDQIIKANRSQFLTMGCIAPVEYHVKSRQALKWLYEEASHDKTINVENKNDVLNRLKSLILIYGPSVICSLFQRKELKSEMMLKTPNWRTGYFVERYIYEYFSIDQLIQMKQKDLDSSPDELVKKFGEMKQDEAS